MNDSCPPGPTSPPESDPLADLEEAEEIHADAPLETPPEFTHLTERAREWAGDQAFRALSRVADRIAANLDFRSLVREILDIAIGAVGAGRGIIWLGKDGAADLVPAAARNVSGIDLVELERVSHTIVTRGRGGEAILSLDALCDPILHDIPSVQVNQIRSVVCVPMSARGERVGVIYLDHAEAKAFPRHARAFLEAFASLAAVALDNARLHGELRRENARMREHLGPLQSFGRIVTASPLMEEVIRKAAVIARADTPLMLLGESGTGKELMARAIHDASPRALHPFVAYNCAAVPRDLMESLFFGHVRGAFTGALRDVPGLFLQADRGVLLLDEIAELDAALQAKLLRVLQDGRIRPLGGDREIGVDVRVIAATSRDLGEAVRNKQFREDLYYRLNVLEIRLPALRERREDIPSLVEHFVRTYAQSSGADSPVRISESALDFLGTLPWSGNVRELENLVRRVLVMCGAGTIGEDQVKALLSVPVEGLPGTLNKASVEDFPAEVPATIAERERVAIINALRRTKGNKTQASRLLGIHRNSLVRRMQRLDIRDSRSELR